MSIISVDAKELGRELAAWGVPHNYAILFVEKSTVKIIVLPCIRFSSMTLSI